ncbi:MAG: flavodoxin family protein [Desulfobacterales bacterium]
MDPERIVAVFGSPRRRGNTAALLEAAVEGAREAGARVDPIVLRDLKIAPCLEIYGCRIDGECRIQDDFQSVRARVLAAGGIMLASPIFYYAVSAQVKILMDRFHSLWVKRHWVERAAGGPRLRRRGLFIAAGATRGPRLFEGALLSVRCFFDTLDCDLWKSLLYRGLDHEDEARGRPELLAEAQQAGAALARLLRERGPGGETQPTGENP